MIPPFQDEGTLPPGEHRASWHELVERFGWSPKRRRLLEGLRLAGLELRKGGIKTLLVNGSFITSKEAPNDYDGCWPGSELEDAGLIDPVLFDFTAGRAAMKRRYGGELFVAEWDATGLGQPFRRFFQFTRDGEEKGIIVLSLETIA
jgi:hypothetical protein